MALHFMLTKSHRPHWNLGEQCSRRIWRQTSLAGLRNCYKYRQFYVFSVSVHILQSSCATTFLLHFKLLFYETKAAST